MNSRRSFGYYLVVLIVFGFVQIAQPITRSFGSLSSPQAQLDLLKKLLNRDPNLMLRILPYQVNVFELMKPVPLILNKLNPAYVDNTSREFNLYGLDFSGSSLKESRNNLKVNTEIILYNADSIPETLPSIREALRSWNNKQLRAIIRLYPLLYDDKGKPYNTQFNIELIRNKLQQMTVKEFEGIYFRSRIGRKIQKKLPGVGYDSLFEEAARSTDKEYLLFSEISGFHSKLYSYYSDQLNIMDSYYFILDEMPPLEAIFRFSCAGDCTHNPLAYYSLLKSTRTFRVYKDSKRKNGGISLHGYVFVVDINGIPLVLGLSSGYFTLRSTQAVLYMISQIYHSDYFYIPNLEANQFLFDNHYVVEVMQLGQQKENLTSILLEGFYELEQLISQLQEINKLGFDNKFSLDRLSQVYKVPVQNMLSKFQPDHVIDDLTIEPHSILNTNQTINVNLLTQALIVVHLLKAGVDIAKIEHDLLNSSIETEILEALQKFAFFTEQDTPTYRDFLKLKGFFGLNWVDLKLFNLKIWRSILSQAVSEDPSLDHEPDYLKSRKLFNEIESQQKNPDGEVSCAKFIGSQ